MAEGSESPSSHKKQLGIIYRERNLGKLITEASAHGAKKAEENIPPHSQGSSPGSEPARQLGKLVISDERREDIDNSGDQANRSKSTESKSSKPSGNIGKLWMNIMEAKTKTDRAGATSRSNAGTAIALFDKESGFLQRFDPRSNSLTQMHNITKEIKGGLFFAVSLGNSIYVLDWNRSVYRLKCSDKTATWERMSDMIEYHGYWPPAVAFSGSIYVVGGSGTHDSRSVEKYDSVTNEWKRLKDKPQSTRNSGVLASRGYIYSFGGSSLGFGYEKSVQRFHLDSATWEDLPPMNEKRANMGVIEFRENIYVMGGVSVIRQSIEKFDPATQQWIMLRPMRINRRKFRCLPIDGCIYAVGGDTSSDTIEKYDVDKDEWKMVDLPRKNKLSIVNSVIIRLQD